MDVFLLRVSPPTTKGWSEEPSLRAVLLSAHGPWKEILAKLHCRFVTVYQKYIYPKWCVLEIRLIKLKLLLGFIYSKKQFEERNNEMCLQSELIFSNLSIYKPTPKKVWVLGKILIAWTRETLFNGLKIICGGNSTNHITTNHILRLKIHNWSFKVNLNLIPPRCSQAILFQK